MTFTITEKTMQFRMSLSGFHTNSYYCLAVSLIQISRKYVYPCFRTYFHPRVNKSAVFRTAVVRVLQWKRPNQNTCTHTKNCNSNIGGFDFLNHSTRHFTNSWYRHDTDFPDQFQLAATHDQIARDSKRPILPGVSLSEPCTKDWNFWLSTGWVSPISGMLSNYGFIPWLYYLW